MTMARFVGGPFDGDLWDVPAGVSSTVFPLMQGGDKISRSLVELELEIRFDSETGAIVAPPDLVDAMRVRRATYQLREDGEFHFREVS